MVARLTANVSPTLLNEFVASYTTDHIGTQLDRAMAAPQRIPRASASITMVMAARCRESWSLAESTAAALLKTPATFRNGPLNSNPTFTYRDNVTKIVGSHNLQFGAYFVNAHKNEIPQPSYGVNGLLTYSNTGLTTSGNAFADLLLGNIGAYTQEGAALKMHEEYKIFEPYFQDDWHVTHRLTLNLGLRMSFYGTYREEK